MNKEEKQLEDAKKGFLQEVQCNFTCSSGNGEIVRVHIIGCPFYICSFEQMNPMRKNGGTYER